MQALMLLFLSKWIPKEMEPKQRFCVEKLKVENDGGDSYEKLSILYVFWSLCVKSMVYTNTTLFKSSGASCDGFVFLFRHLYAEMILQD